MSNDFQEKQAAKYPYISDMIDAFGRRFKTLTKHLIKGNLKKSLTVADEFRGKLKADGLNICSQNMIEERAYSQSIKNAMLNAPSFLPGFGTAISLLMLHVENFLMLDESITLALSLCHLHGAEIKKETIDDFIILVIGEAYGLIEAPSEDHAQKVAQGYFKEVLPSKYANIGFTKLLGRLFPYRRKSRLIPGGIGIAASALDGYETLVKVGQASLKYMYRLKNLE